MRPASNATKFELPDALWHVLRHFETECVGGCCGRRAFWFDAGAAASLKEAVPSTELREVKGQLHKLIAELSAVAGPVDTLMITDEWDGRRAARWFTGIEKFLNRHCNIA